MGVLKPFDDGGFFQTLGCGYTPALAIILMVTLEFKDNASYEELTAPLSHTSKFDTCGPQDVVVAARRRFLHILSRYCQPNVKN